MSIVRIGWACVVMTVGLMVGGCCKSNSGSSTETTTESTTIPAKVGANTTAASWIAKADGAGCKKLAGQSYAVSVQASTAYSSMVEMMAKEGFKAKQHATYQCGSEKVGFYAYEYDDAAHAKSGEQIIGALIWGPDGRTSEHPERIVNKGNVFLVISSRNTTALDKL